MVVRDLLITRQVVTRDLHQAAFTPDTDDQPYLVAKRLDDIDKAEAGNITVHSGYDPSVGFGRARHRQSAPNLVTQ